jgi:hypothetical protein
MAAEDPGFMHRCRALTREARLQEADLTRGLIATHAQGHELQALIHLPFLLQRIGEKLGGNALRLFRTLKGVAVKPFLLKLIAEVEGHDDIRVHNNARVVDVQGFVGNSKTHISERGGEPLEIPHGVAVLATGASEWKPYVFGYGTDPRIRTQWEMG